MTTLLLKNLYKLEDRIIKIVPVLIILIVTIVFLSVLQEKLESVRQGSNFYLSESILFKLIWIYYLLTIPYLLRLLRDTPLMNYFLLSGIIVASVIIHLILYMGSFLLFSSIFYNYRYDLVKILSFIYANELFKMIVIYSILVVSIKYLKSLSNDLQEESKNSNEYKKSLIISHKKDKLIVNTQEINYITASSPYVSIQVGERKFLHSQSLKSLLLDLDPALFIQIHKSTIINIRSIHSFTSRSNGDYEVILKNGTIFRLSRNYVRQFKNIINSSNTQVSI